MRSVVIAGILAGAALLAWRAEAGDGTSIEDRLAKIEDTVRRMDQRLTAVEASAALRTDPTQDAILELGPKRLDKPPGDAEKRLLMELWVASLMDAASSGADLRNKLAAAAVLTSSEHREMLEHMTAEILKLRRALMSQMDDLLHWRAKGLAAGLEPVKR